MLRLAGIVISIGLADSLNPTTIAPALYLASGPHPRQNVLRFTAGVFFTYLLGGAVILLGPGQLLLSLVPHPDAAGRQGLEVGVGAVLLIVGAIIWRHQDALAEREVPRFVRQPRSHHSALLGATIMAVELPTAFPYFAAIAAIVGSGLGLARQLVLLVLFNVCFVLPLVFILATLAVAPDRAQERLSRARLFLHRRWPRLLGWLMLLVGVFVVLLGATGLAGHAHGRVARFFRHVHKALP